MLWEMSAFRQGSERPDAQQQGIGVAIAASQHSRAASRRRPASQIVM
jgi:hypothetical protein